MREPKGSESFWSARGEDSLRGDWVNFVGFFFEENWRPKKWLIGFVVACAIILAALLFAKGISGGTNKGASVPTPTPTKTAEPSPTATATPFTEISSTLLKSIPADWVATKNQGCEKYWSSPTNGLSSVLVEGRMRGALVSSGFTANTTWGNSGFTLSGTGESNGFSNATIQFDLNAISICLN